MSGVASRIRENPKLSALLAIDSHETGKLFAELLVSGENGIERKGAAGLLEEPEKEKGQAFGTMEP